VIHDQLSALFRDTRPHPRFHTPAVSFDMSQRDLRAGSPSPRPEKPRSRHHRPVSPGDRCGARPA
jgi:hypothetical protein